MWACCNLKSLQAAKCVLISFLSIWYWPHNIISFLGKSIFEVKTHTAQAMPKEIVEISLKRNKGEPWGLRIGGGVDRGKVLVLEKVKSNHHSTLKWLQLHLSHYNIFCQTWKVFGPHSKITTLHTYSHLLMMVNGIVKFHQRNLLKSQFKFNSHSEWPP